MVQSIEIQPQQRVFSAPQELQSQTGDLRDQRQKKNLAPSVPLSGETKKIINGDRGDGAAI